ncbi:hypothetical protein C8R47DRAFT_1127291 [Mycena vitilis]|nr:hypothetical protein C8R47DRAFT_1127291 [Mycena vitilis]
METTSVATESKPKSVPSLRVFVSDRGYIFREGEEDIQHVIADPPEGLAWTEKRTMDEPTASLPGSERQKPKKQKPEKPIQYWTQRCTFIRPPVSLDIEVRKQLGQALNPDGTFDQWVYCPYTFQADITETAGNVHARFEHGAWRVHEELFYSDTPNDKPDLYMVTAAIMATGLGRIPDPGQWVRCWLPLSTKWRPQAGVE